MYSVHTERKKRVDKDREQETHRKDNHHTTAQWRKKRNAMAESYKQRVGEWIEKTDMMDAKPTPPAAERKPYSLTGGRHTHFDRHLARPRMQFKASWVPEKERVALADQVMKEREVNPYENPKCDIRLRQKRKEVHPPMRYTAKTQNERIVDVLEDTPPMLSNAGAHWLHPTLPVFRHVDKSRWRGAEFNRTFERVKANRYEELAHPAHVTQMLEGGEHNRVYETEPYNGAKTMFRPSKQPEDKPLYQSMVVPGTSGATTARRSGPRPTPQPPRPRHGAATVRDYRKKEKTYWRAAKETAFGPESNQDIRPLYYSEFPPQETVNYE